MSGIMGGLATLGRVQNKQNRVLKGGYSVYFRFICQGAQDLARVAVYWGLGWSLPSSGPAGHLLPHAREGEAWGLWAGFLGRPLGRSMVLGA